MECPLQKLLRGTRWTQTPIECDRRMEPQGRREPVKTDREKQPKSMCIHGISVERTCERCKLDNLRAVISYATRIRKEGNQ
jgi:hypothetical protein